MPNAYMTKSSSPDKQKRMKGRDKFGIESMNENLLNRHTDRSMSDSKCLINSSSNRKVTYNVDLNYMRKKIMSNVQVDLNLVVLTNYCMKYTEPGGCVEFDPSKEGFILGEATIRFKLQEMPDAKSFFLDFCGDRVFEMSVNGLQYGVDTIEWNNNQITLSKLREGRKQTHHRK